MKKTKRRALYILAALLGALFVLSCLVGFAACGGSTEDACADGHTVTSWTTTKEADCGNDGTRTGVCDVCGETVTETVKATGEHSYVVDADNSVDATCTTDGTTAYVCEVCGDTSKTSDTVQALGHDYVLSEDSVAATELQNGKTVMKCSRCDATTTEVVKATGTWNTFEAEDGLLDAGTSTKFGTEKHDSTTSGSPASGGMNVKDFEDGSYVAFRINSSAAVTGTTLTVIGASNNSSVTTTDLDMSNAAVTLNGQKVTLSGTFPGGGLFNYSNWSDAATATINLVQGDNIFVFSGMTKTRQYNFDAIQIVSPAGVTLTDTTKGVLDSSEEETYTTEPLTTCVTSGHVLEGTYTAGSGSEEGTWSYKCSLCGDKNIDFDDWRPVKSASLTATDEESLKAAVAWNEANADLTVVLDATAESGGTKTISLASTAVEISQAVTLDLNGCVLTTSGQGGKDFNTITVKKGGSLTVVDGTADEATGIGTGKIANTYPRQSSQPAANNAAAIYTSGDVVIESGVIDSTSVGIHAVNGSVEINGGVVYSSQYYSIWEGDGQVDVTINDGIVAGDVQCILVDGDSNFGHGGYYSFNAVTNLTVNGGEIYSGGLLQGAIRTESMTSAKSAKITINDGTIFCGDNKGKVTMEGQTDSLTQSAYKNEPAIFMGNGTLEVNGGTITGPTALEVQAGKTTVSGGTFVSSYTGQQNIDPTVGSSDPYTYGYALAIYPRGYIARTNDSESIADGFSMATDVTVSGGKFVGDIYESATNYNKTSPVGTWTLNTADDDGVVNYKVDMSALGMTLTPYDSSDNPITEPNSGTEAAYYLYTYADLTANFVTGAYDQNAGVPGGVYTFGGNNTFTGSNITVERVGTTYIVNGTTGSMTQEQAAAFYNEDEASDHIGDKYIVVAIVAGADEQITVKSSVDGTTYVLDGNSSDPDWTFYTLCFNVTNYDTNENFDSLCFTLVVDGVEFDVVLGEITEATVADSD